MLLRFHLVFKTMNCFLFMIFTHYIIAVRGDFSMPLWAFHPITQTALRQWSLLRRYGILMVGYFSNYHLFDLSTPAIGHNAWFDLVSAWISVYPDGRVCISILHPPGEDPNGYELASERWTPVHTVCISLLLPLMNLNLGNPHVPTSGSGKC